MVLQNLLFFCCGLISFWISPGFSKGTEFCGFLRQWESGNGHPPWITEVRCESDAGATRVLLGWVVSWFAWLGSLFFIYCFSSPLKKNNIFLFRVSWVSEKLPSLTLSFHLNTSPISICITNGWRAEASSHGLSNRFPIQISVWVQWMHGPCHTIQMDGVLPP